jgi:hypothetical protein
MKIVRHQILSTIETLDRLSNVCLKGFDRFPIYRDAKMEIVRSVPTDALTPPQRYVLRPTVEKIIEIADAFEMQQGIDVFGLAGALLFWTDGMDLQGDPIPFLPPVVEDSVERFNPKAMLVNDGMHRTFAARWMGRDPSIIHVSGLPPEYPYYAYGIEEGWAGVVEIDELTDGFKKKDYRNPDNYKALFRDFNAVFPGIQEQRKQTQAHLKE